MNTQKCTGIAVVDVETNALDAPVDIVEVAVILLHPVSLVTLEEFHTLVRPAARNTTGRVDIHGVTAEMVSDAPSFEQIAPQIAGMLDGKVLAAHNLPFDVARLAEEFARLGTEFITGRGICTYQLTGRTLSESAITLNVQHSNAHAALEDARATAGIMRSCYRQVTTQDVSACSISLSSNATQNTIKQRPSVLPRKEQQPTSSQVASLERHLKQNGASTKEISAFQSATALETSQLIKGLQQKRIVSVPLATDRQKRYLSDLLYENGMHHDNLDSLTKIEASNLIDELLKNPGKVRARISSENAKQSPGCFSLYSLWQTLSSFIEPQNISK